MAQGDQDKTEQPTPYRLEEARKRGEVAKSAEVSGFVVMLAFAVVVALSAAGIAQTLAGATRNMIALAGHAPMPDAGLVAWIGHAYGPFVQAIAPLALALVVAAVLGNVMQTGPMFTTHPLVPDFKRLNPTNAFKRVFSFRTIWELGKLVVKLALLCAVGALFAWKARALAESVAVSNPQKLGALALVAFGKASLYVLLVLGLFALVDLLFSRREFMKKMRMSRRELKEEFKRRDGDPHVKQKQRQQIRDLLKKARAMTRVREADVVLVNPTHVAVALRYRPGQTLAPVVLAKGAGVLAARIRRLAARHGVPVRTLPPLARALYRECDIDGMVPEARYLELAPLYRALWAARGGVPA